MNKYVKSAILMSSMTLAASNVLADDSEALFTVKQMTLETAQNLAKATLEDCRKQGYQVAVAVVDRFGNLQVLLRDRYAGPHTVETARRKAYTSVSFRTDTITLMEMSQAGEVQSGVRNIPQVLMLGGGLPVEAAGSLVGGVGVSGAPGGDIDQACAQSGIDTIADDLEF